MNENPVFLPGCRGSPDSETVARGLPALAKEPFSAVPGHPVPQPADRDQGHRRFGSRCGPPDLCSDRLVARRWRRDRGRSLWRSPVSSRRPGADGYFRAVSTWRRGRQLLALRLSQVVPQRYLDHRAGASPNLAGRAHHRTDVCCLGDETPIRSARWPGTNISTAPAQCPAAVVAGGGHDLAIPMRTSFGADRRQISAGIDGRAAD